MHNETTCEQCVAEIQNILSHQNEDKTGLFIYAPDQRTWFYIHCIDNIQKTSELNKFLPQISPIYLFCYKKEGENITVQLSHYKEMQGEKVVSNTIALYDQAIRLGLLHSISLQIQESRIKINATVTTIDGMYMQITRDISNLSEKSAFENMDPTMNAIGSVLLYFVNLACR